MVPRYLLVKKIFNLASLLQRASIRLKSGCGSNHNPVNTAGVFVHTNMGSNTSRFQSESSIACKNIDDDYELVIQNIDNDYELVIRVSKDLEHELKTKFGYNDDGLSAKLNQLQNEFPYMASIRNMRQLVKWRNKLVHEVQFDSLSDLGISKTEFRSLFLESKSELECAELRSGRKNAFTPQATSSGTALSNQHEEEDGWGTALMVGGAMAAGLALLASSSTSRCCSLCGRPIRGDRTKCSGCS